MLNALRQGLLCALCLDGIALALAALIAVFVGTGALILWWADHWGAWMDEHPEQERKGKADGQKR